MDQSVCDLWLWGRFASHSHRRELMAGRKEGESRLLLVRPSSHSCTSVVRVHLSPLHISIYRVVGRVAHLGNKSESEGSLFPPLLHFSPLLCLNGRLIFLSERDGDDGGVERGASERGQGDGDHLTHSSYSSLPPIIRPPSLFCGSWL